MKLLKDFLKIALAREHLVLMRLGVAYNQKHALTGEILIMHSLAYKKLSHGPSVISS